MVYFTMTITQIKSAISGLPPSSVFELADWMEELLAKQIDDNLKLAVSDGKFDDLANEALSLNKSGECTEL